MADAQSTSTEMVLQHLGEESHVLGAVVPPIFQNSLFVSDEMWDWTIPDAETDPLKKKYVYSRNGNPTLEIVEQKIAALEHCEACRVFSSGMAAISSAIMSCVQQGSHVVCVDTCYGPTRQFLLDYLPKFGVTTTMVEGSNTDELIAAVRPETTLIYLESPSSLIFRQQDLRAICRFAREKGISTIIDNSYASPIFQTPADFGVDMITHSATKYLAGHSDITAGVVATSNERMKKLNDFEVALFGSALAPFPAWLLLRGLRTLKIRMMAHRETGNRVAAFLAGDSRIVEVFHVGLPCYEHGELRDSQMSGSGGLLSFVPKCQDPDKLRAFAAELDVFQIGVSWGGFESLVVTMPIKPLHWPEERWLVRLYCGLETPEDLIEDLRRAMTKVGL